MKEAIPFTLDFLLDTNNLYARLLYFDWSNTPLGPSKEWSLSTQMAVSQIIHSNFRLSAAEADKPLLLLQDTNSKLYLEHLLSQIPIAICILRGQNHTIVSANQWMLELWGKTAEEVLHKPLFEAIFESAGQGFEELLARTYHHGEHFSANEVPVRLSRNEGIETVYTNVAYEPFRQKDGLIAGVVAVATDVTATVMVRRKIEESEKQKSGIINSLNAHIAMLNANGEIIMVNKAWTQFAVENGGTALQGMSVGDNYLQVLQSAEGEHSEEAPIVSEGILAVINGELPLYSMEYPCHSPVQQRWFMMQVSPLTYGGGGVIVSHTNISERKLSELVLRENEQRLRSLSETLEQKVQEHARILAEMTEQLRQKA